MFSGSNPRHHIAFALNCPLMHMSSPNICEHFLGLPASEIWVKSAARLTGLPPAAFSHRGPGLWVGATGLPWASSKLLCSSPQPSPKLFHLCRCSSLLFGQLLSFRAPFPRVTSLGCPLCPVVWGESPPICSHSSLGVFVTTSVIAHMLDSFPTGLSTPPGAHHVGLILCFIPST